MSITCPYCSDQFDSDTISSRHKSKCAGWVEVLGDTRPRPCLCGHEATSLTQMKRHRSGCGIWKSRDRGSIQADRLADTFQDKYGEGVTHPSKVEGFEENRAVTVRGRYGGDNVFSKNSSTYPKVQESLKGKRPVMKGSDNPFSRPEVKEKIRATKLRKKQGNPQ